MVSLDHFLWLHQEQARVQAQQEVIAALNAQMPQDQGQSVPLSA
jgi:hypothetical protein